MTSRIPVVFLPGLLCDQELWRDQIEALADLAVMQVADFTQGEALETFADRAIALIEAPCMLVGLSMGGYVALEVMRRAQDRVRSLVLIDTSARPDNDERKSGRRDMIALAGRATVFHGASRRLLAAMVAESRHGDQELMGRIREMTRRVGRDVFIRQQTALLSRHDAREVLPTIRVPTYILVGRQDIITPVEHAEEMQRGIAGALLEIIDDCGHLSTMERPDVISKKLRSWLAALAP